MYDKILDTFQVVAESGSFTKASQKLYMTHTALIKQMNNLEERLNVKLFHRTNHGITLTPAGQVLYSELDSLKALSHQIIEDVQNTNASSPKILTVGTSPLYPIHNFMKVWELFSEKHPEFQLNVVSFQNEQQRLDYLNHSFDFLVGPFNSRLNNKNYTFVPLGKYQFAIALDKNHPLAKKKSLCFANLNHEHLMIMKEGYSPINDQIRKELLTHYPTIHLVDTHPSYDTETFNQCINNHYLLLSLECWKDVHPSLQTIPLKENYQIPYGIVCLNSASSNTKEFIHLIKKVIATKNI